MVWLGTADMFDGQPKQDETMSQPDSETSPRSSQTTAATAPAGGHHIASEFGGGPPPPPTRKTRVALACKRCKRRKQRCDGSHPVCKSCERAGTPCLYEKTMRPQYPGGKSLYINALEERIAFLEARLPAYAEDHFDTTKDHAATASRGEAGRTGSVSEDADAEEHSSLVDGVAYLSLCASGTTDTAPEPFYLGSSSGAAIARMIQTSIFHSSAGRTISQEAQLAFRAHGPRVRSPPPPFHSPSASQAAPLLSMHVDDSTSEFPFLDQARLLFDVFFDRLHTRWPILDREEYARLFDKQYEQGSLSIIQRSIMHLIYAISSRFLQLTRKPCGVDSEQHLIAAIEPMDYILEQHNLSTVQFLLLLAVHGQRSPYGAGAWSQVRGTSVVLGRAFAIADRDINVELPSPSIEFWTLTHKEPPDASQGPLWSNIEPFIHIIKLERLQSRIHRTVFRVDKDVFCTGSPQQRAKLDRKMADIRADLDAWIRTVPQSPKNSKRITWMYDPESAYHDSRDFFNLQYHKAILTLFTILLPTLSSTDPRFVTSARSAACVCIAYKRLNQQQTLSYTMISLHSCFVAGLTLMYCLWRDKSLFSFDVLEAVRACSQSLTIFGEKWSGAIKYRDIFDALSGSLLKTVVNSSNSSATHADVTGAGPKPLRIDLDSDLGVTSPESQMDANRQAGHLSPDSARNQDPRDAATAKPTLSNLVSNAVKEAFMEVDEEAPGGWQGWRMWNDMVRDGLPAAEPDYIEPEFSAAGRGYADPGDTGWSDYGDGAFYNGG
ncbi:hypothetical protein VTK73DRAFT_2405 [Phialemonium thermophilum]|uniref:Zn(2)-C6 fungal-type domain-containing protein n=1 Tax=Phialemonium thermophilum TaxID=223376 RepID=A0ABR3X4F2_9PEZI